MIPHDFMSASGPDYVYQDEHDRDVSVLNSSITSLWREVVLLRALLGLTGLALLLLTLAVALR